MKVLRCWLVLIFAALVPAPAHADVSSPARVIDGNTIEISGTPIRLFGIAAPHPDQNCHTKWDKPYKCGVLAAQVLASLIVRRTLVCADVRPDGNGGLVAVRRVGRLDLGEQMVLRGWALADPESGAAYRYAERAARQVGDGLWKGKFVPPWDWRGAE